MKNRGEGTLIGITKIREVLPLSHYIVGWQNGAAGHELKDIPRTNHNLKEYVIGWIDGKNARRQAIAEAEKRIHTQKP